MNKDRLHIILFVALLVLLLAACKPTSVTETPLPGGTTVATYAVQTFVAQLTSSAGQTAVAQLTQIALNSPVVTPVPPALVTATLTLIPPSSTPIPGTPTPQPVPCNWVELVTNVTVDDGTLFQPDTPFTKTWRLKNIGSCAWTTGYALVFTGGDQLSGPVSILLNSVVEPGQTVDISIDLLAASTPGVYTGYWQLRDASGVLFGTGSDANAPFWVQIKVGPQLQIPYDFVSIVCAANWSTSNVVNLVCPSPNYDTVNGFVIVQSNPILENGATSTSPAIITYPSQGNGGMISGRYPAFQVRNGDRFKTAIGCLYQSLSCYVVFMLNYSVDNGPVLNLGTWSVTYTNHFRSLDIDLSPLAGQSVEFILTVFNNGNSTEDWAYWLMPAIYR